VTQAARHTLRTFLVCLLLVTGIPCFSMKPIIIQYRMVWKLSNFSCTYLSIFEYGNSIHVALIAELSCGELCRGERCKNTGTVSPAEPMSQCITARFEFPARGQNKSSSHSLVTAQHPRFSVRRRVLSKLSVPYITCAKRIYARQYCFLVRPDMDSVLPA